MVVTLIDIDSFFYDFRITDLSIISDLQGVGEVFFVLLLMSDLLSPFNGLNSGWILLVRCCL